MIADAATPAGLAGTGVAQTGAAQTGVAQTGVAQAGVAWTEVAGGSAGFEVAGGSAGIDAAGRPAGADAVPLAGGVAGAEALAPRIAAVLDALAAGATTRGGPVPAGSPQRIAEEVAAAFDGELLPEHGVGDLGSLSALTAVLAGGAADPADARCAGHLHCPPLAVAVAAEVAAAALNPSLDSWDQGPAATALEPHVVGVLAALVGYDPKTAGGVLTSGATESNLMGLLLARDHAVRASFGLDAAVSGVPQGLFRVVCSEAAHFSVQRAAALLGLGEDAVVAVPVDGDQRMDVTAAAERVARFMRNGEVCAAIVATAGTTDFGSIDPLPELADLARRHGAWLHVDAAYGGGALFSARLAPLLHDLARADSVAVDLHKLGWQPVPAGAFLVRDDSEFAPLARRVEYLNPADDEDAGYPSLLGRSLRTTRRVDAFKLAVTFRALGRVGLGRLVDACHDLALHAAAVVAGHPRLELAAPPVLTSVVFRYVTGGDSDAVNAALRRRLLTEGRAVVGRTEFAGGVWLKLTLLNPHSRPSDIEGLLADVVAAGAREDV